MNAVAQLENIIYNHEEQNLQGGLPSGTAAWAKTKIDQQTHYGRRRGKKLSSKLTVKKAK